MRALPLVLVLVALPAAARADAVTSQDHCDDGSAPGYCHTSGVGHCVAQRCEVGAACGPGHTCRLRSVCYSGLPCGSPTAPDGAVPSARAVAGVCDPGQTCGGSID